MPPKLLADENIPWPLVRLLRGIGLDIIWIPETSYRGISDIEVINLANRDKRIILTRDSDYLELGLRRRAEYGIIYIGEPVRKDNVEKLADNTVKALETMEKKSLLAIITPSITGLYPLTL